MSRQTRVEGPLEIHFGNDNAIGRFIDVCDTRYAGTEHDDQGEGYVVEWSDLFGLSTNLINVTVDEITTGKFKEIIAKADVFIENNFKIIK